MPAVKIKDGVYWIGVNDRTTDLFEGLWPITREGVSYNSYLIMDEKNVLIDLAKYIKTDVFFDHIAEMVDLKDIDYVVINHVEPDHTGVLRILRQMAPEVKILCSSRARDMLADYYGLSYNIGVVEDGEILHIGRRKLKFLLIPFVHWPETMATYETTERILFSCDAFGGYGAVHTEIFSDQCHNIEFYRENLLRYFVNIIAKFSKPVLNAISKVEKLPIDIIAPSHGLIWRENPDQVIKLYRKWAEYAEGETESGITLLYGSMYGNTEAMMNSVARGISEVKIPVTVFDVARTHPSYILPSLWVNKGVIIGAPTYEGGLFPPMKDLLEKAGLKRILNKKALMFGSYGWSGGALRQIKSIIEPLKWELVDSLEFRGRPTPETLKRGEELGTKFSTDLTS